ncbi:MAG: sulfite exporter TauE/SafE family protein [Gammaproteobacteria bacterium]|nr:MAG: sulfite exporter TauE/SafE family protein [Gammaproteobacteria bacterium]
MDSLILYLLAGSLAGLIGGLFGLGGGAVVVPVLIYCFKLGGVNEEVLTHLAIGTSLATIVVTSLSSIYTHHRKAAVLWPVTLWMVPGIGLGVVAGSVFATELSGSTLQNLFGAFLIFVAFQMALGGSPKPHRELPGRLVGTGNGAGIGFVSGIFGIGGGSLSVPYLAYCNVNITNAIATSAALGFPIALLGALTYIYRGWQVTGLPEGALGFVFLPAFLGIVVTSVPFARLGALLAHRLPAKHLKRLFAVVALGLGVGFISSNS